MVTYENTLEEIQDFFKNDRFATNAGCVITEVKQGFARCEMPITPELFNANGAVMGGVYFTLADFALAVVCNTNGHKSVGIAASIRWFRPATGKKLIAECTAEKVGRSIGFYRIVLTDETGKLIATYEGTTSETPAE